MLVVVYDGEISNVSSSTHPPTLVNLIAIGLRMYQAVVIDRSASFHT